MSTPTRTAFAFALAAFLAGAMHTAGAADGGDPVRGQHLAYTCLGCHAIEGYKNVYPTYSVPKLGGQHAEYIATALRGYRSGDRSHGTMHAHAASLTDQEIADIAAYLGGDAIKPAETPPAKTPPEAAQVCVACHGVDGVGVLPEYPTLAGQHVDYLERALEEYKSGARKNPIMAGFVTMLGPEDIKTLSAYYSSQRPSLETVKKRTSRFSAR